MVSSEPLPRLGRRTAGAALILMAGFIASRLTGLLREAAIGYQFGTSRDYDLYLAAIRIPDTLFQVIAGGAVAAAFIPVFARHRAISESQGWRLVCTLIHLAVLIFAPLTAVLIALAPVVVGVVAPGFGAAERATAAQLTRILLLQPFFFALGTLITSILNARQRFALAALAPSFYNLGLIAGALVLSGPLHLGIHGLALGATLGAAFYLLVQIPGLPRSGLRYQPVLDLRHPGLGEMGRLVLPRVLGLAAAQVNFLVLTALASDLPGGISALHYAWLLVMLPLGIFAMAVSTAVFPTLAEQGAQAALDDLRSTTLATLRLILFLTIPAAVGLGLLAEPLVRLLLERGRFDPAATATVSGLLRVYALGLVAWAAIEILTRGFYALHDTRTPVALSLLGMGANSVGALVLRPSLGPAGLALAMALAAWLEAGLLGWRLYRRLPGPGWQTLKDEVARALGAAAVMAGGLFLGRQLVASAEGPLATAGQVGGLGTLGALLYLGSGLVFGCTEARQLRRLAQRLRAIRTA